MKISRNEGLAAIAVSIIGYLGWSLYKSNQKLNDKQEEYNADLEQLKTDITKEIRDHIHDSVVDEAINRASREMVSSRLTNCEHVAVKMAEARIDNTINQTVNSTWDKLKANVEKELLEKAGDIDVTEIKREAIEQARDKAVGDASIAVDQVVDDIRDMFEKRANEVIKTGEKKYNKRLDNDLSYLKNRYQDKIWDSMWRS